MKSTTDEYGRVHYELPNPNAGKKLKRMLTRPRIARRA